MRSKLNISLALLLMFQIAVGQNQANIDKIALSLQQEMRKASDADYIHIHIVLEDQVDFSKFQNLNIGRNQHYKSINKDVVISLQDKAKESQEELSSWLNDETMVKVASIKKHWLVNAISMKVRRDYIWELSSIPNIKWIGMDSPLLPTMTSGLTIAPLAPDGAELGLKAINAHKMWNLGYTGEGTTTFTADTGVEPWHPAISAQFGGNVRPLNQVWFDFEGTKPDPFDCNNHGTHVTGTTVGLDRLNRDTIGVAFNANYIAGAILCGTGTSDNIGAFEWALNPDGDIDTYDDVPDVINNSWYDPTLPGLDCYSIYIPILEALEAAGLAVVFSAGNEGPDPMTITQPHNININEVNSFTVAAVNGNTPALPIASFSSRGPSHCPGEGSLVIKPEVSAPGVEVRSALKNNEYGRLSGTSMAAPHTSGALLLLREAFPYLSGKELKLSLYHTARDLGEVGEDNTFGMGMIDVYAAYEYLIAKGNTPANPYKNNDIILLDAKHDNDACDNTLLFNIEFENAGIDTLRSAVIKITTIDDHGTQIDELSLNWEGELAFGMRELLEVEPISIPSGIFDFIIEIMDPNNSIDEKMSNNTKKLTVNVLDQSQLPSSFTLTENICTQSSFNINGPSHPTLPYTVRWYYSLLGGTPIYSGQNIFLPFSTPKQDLYAELEIKDELPNDGLLLENVVYNSPLLSGIEFDVLHNMVIDSMTMYSKRQGIRKIELYDQDGKLIHTTRKNLTKIGVNKAKFDWALVPGKHYKLLLVEGADLGYDSLATNFPYKTSSEAISITNGWKNDSIYPAQLYFYDWKISYVNPCGRIKYTIPNNSTLVVGKADFTVSADTLIVETNQVLTASNTSENYQSLLWMVNNESTFTTPQIDYTFDKVGVYPISLQIIDNNGCVVTKNKNIVVLSSTSTHEVQTIEDIDVYTIPNPSESHITLYWPTFEALNTTIDVNLLDGLGRPVLVKNAIVNDGEELINISGLANGVYTLVWSNHKLYKAIKVVKL